MALYAPASSSRRRRSSTRSGSPTARRGLEACASTSPRPRAPARPALRARRVYTACARSRSPTAGPTARPSASCTSTTAGADRARAGALALDCPGSVAARGTPHRHLPGDGIGRDHGPDARAADALGDFEFEEHVFGGASIDAHGTALTDEVLAACRGPTRCCSRPSAGPSGTRPTRRAAPRAGPARPAQGPRPVREPAPGQAAARRCTTPRRCGASGSRAPTCWSCAS